MDVTIETAGGLAVIVITLTAVRFVYEKYFERKRADYEVYHKIIEELVGAKKDGNDKPNNLEEGEQRKKGPLLDCQIANIFELRHYPRYYPVTKRILIGLKEYWSKSDNRLIEEINLTLNFIDKYYSRPLSFKAEESGQVEKYEFEEPR